MRERETEREACALRQDRRARGTSAHRPGQEAAKMEIRPDRFKAVAGKTLGKIHRYTPISDIPNSRAFSFFFFPRARQSNSVGGGSVAGSHPSSNFQV